MKRRASHLPRKRRRRKLVPLPLLGLVGIATVLVAAVVAYEGPSTFEGNGFQLNAIFTSDAQLSLHSPVRIAGVPVGSVACEHPLGGHSNAVVVTMSIGSNGLPVHTDATVQIRPRLLLEGNFYIELHPGTPRARTLHSGQTLPVSQTSGPVQIDRVLSSLNVNTRSDLRRLLQGFGSALGGDGPSGNAPEDRRTVGKTAGQALHDGLRNAAPALRDLALTTTAVQGSRPHDLSELIAGSNRVFGALASQQSHLASLIANFNTTMAALAAEQHSLGQTVGQLPGFLQRAGATDQRVAAAIPPTRTFAHAIVPGLSELPPTISAGSPWIEQAKLLFARDDLGGLAASLTPAVRDTAQAVSAGRPLLSALDLLDQCLVRNALPTADQTIADPPLLSGVRVRVPVQAPESMGRLAGEVRRRGSALAVGGDADDDAAGARHRSRRDVVLEQARHVAEQECRVVAGCLRGGQERHERLEHSECERQTLDSGARRRGCGEPLERLQPTCGLLADGRHLREVAGAGDERVGKRRRAGQRLRRWA
jgi:virulence factor Mce-like protein